MSSKLKIIILKEILLSLGNSVIKIVGRQDRIIKKPAPINESKNEHDITFCNLEHIHARESLNNTKAGVIVCSKSLELDEIKLKNKTLIIVENPRLSFLRLVNAFFAPAKPTGIHSTAVISPEAKISTNVFIGPYTCIGACEIGEGSVIHGHVYIYDNTTIGQNCIINAGTVIGTDGFGYHRNEMDELEKFPHIGGVVIEDNVEIGSNASIDRGTLGNTIISSGAKIDNFVHIAHNVTIGKHAVVIAHSMIGGSCKIGNFAWIAPCACIRDVISVGDKATVGLGALVVKDVPVGTTVMGAPAKPIKEYKRILQGLHNLAEYE